MPGMSPEQSSAGRLTPGENRQVPIELQDFYKSNPPCNMRLRTEPASTRAVKSEDMNSFGSSDPS